MGPRSEESASATGARLPTRLNLRISLVLGCAGAPALTLARCIPDHSRITDAWSRLESRRGSQDEKHMAPALSHSADCLELDRQCRRVPATSGRNADTVVDSFRSGEGDCCAEGGGRSAEG